MQRLRFQIITLFPSMFEEVFSTSILWKAQKDGHVRYETIDLRRYGLGPRKTVDDTPYGGGDGMVLRPEPLFAAVEQAKRSDPQAEVLLMTPRGQLFKHSIAAALAANRCGKIIICGRYEGYDERITTLVDRQISIGNFVLTGGEVPAMAVVDSVTRLVPGVLGGAASALHESFDDDFTPEHPHYTRPEEFRGLKVPEVLLSGNHAEIAAWRKQQRPGPKV